MSELPTIKPDLADSTVPYLATETDHELAKARLDEAVFNCEVAKARATIRAMRAVRGDIKIFYDQ